MTGNGTVTLNGRIIAKGVLAQIKPDSDGPGWCGTLYISAGKFIGGEPRWMQNRYGLQLDGGPSGQFIVTTRQPVGDAIFFEVRGSGALEALQGGRINRV